MKSKNYGPLLLMAGVILIIGVNSFMSIQKGYESWIIINKLKTIIMKDLNVTTYYVDNATGCITTYNPRG